MMDKGWRHRYESAKKAFEAKKFDTALVLLEGITAEKNNYADVYNMLGLVYYYGSRLDDAVGAFERAVEINPGYTEASLNLAVVYNELGKFDSSTRAYNQAKESRKEADSYLDPYVLGKLANMHAGIGSIYKDLGFYPQAVDEYKKALTLRPDCEDIRTDLGVAYRDMRDFANSIKELSDAVAFNPDYLKASVQLGLTYYMMGDSDRARAEWKQVLERHPGDKMARMYMKLLAAPSG